MISRTSRCADCSTGKERERINYGNQTRQSMKKNKKKKELVALWACRGLPDWAKATYLSPININREDIDKH